MVSPDVAGALDINWAVLVRDTNKPSTNEVAVGTALKRFKAPHLLARLGVSTRFARPEVIQSIKETCTAQSDSGKCYILIPMAFCISSVHLLC